MKRKLLQKILAEVGLSISVFDKAFNDAKKLCGSIQTEQSDRIKVSCALSYCKDGRLCDLGSYVNMYPVVLALLGMRVTISTTVDYYPQASPDHPHHSQDIPKVLDIYRSVAIEVIESNLYDVMLLEESFDIVTSFETFEHFWHSPKPVMHKIVAALRLGGDFVLSVPNIVSLKNRLKVIMGQSPLPHYPFFFEHGHPLTGHRGEMTIGEVHYMMTAMGLHRKKLFCGKPCRTSDKEYNCQVTSLQDFDEYFSSTQRTSAYNLCCILQRILINL